MSQIRKKLLAIHIIGMIFGWIVIHFFLADAFASLTGVNVGLSYFVLFSFLILWGIRKAIQIAQGKDQLAAAAEKSLSPDR